MSIYAFFMARVYDAALGRMEQSCLGRWRAELLQQAAGDVLEIGSGTGANLPHYPTDITSLILSEPDPHMRRELQRKLDQQPDISGKIAAATVDDHDFPDASFDCVVSTLVLCSVPSQCSALAAIRRLLRPGGRLLFIEHVMARDNQRLRRWQNRIQPLWVPLCGNCHLTRDTERALLDAGFRLEMLEHRNSSGGPKIVSPTILGVARRQ